MCKPCEQLSPGIKKYTNMKSKAVFDLDQANNAVIKLRIESTDDVRDKIACQFSDKLREFSNLVVVANKPDSSDGKNYELYPLPANDRDKISELLYFVSMDQLKKLPSLFQEEIDRRELMDISPEPEYRFTFLIRDDTYSKLLGHGITENGKHEYWFKDQLVSEKKYIKVINQIKNIQI